MAKKPKFLILLALLFVHVVPTIALSYVLPSSQIMRIMADKFSLIKTLTITQQTKIQDLKQEKETTFSEIISLRSPYLFRSEIPMQPDKRLIIHNNSKTLRILNNRISYDDKSYDFMYRFFFQSYVPNRLLEMLNEVGINTDKTSLTRFEGTIAYLIGEKNKGSARLVIDKERFLPLLLKYGDHQFRFYNYNVFTENAWYPFQIVYSYKKEIIEEYAVRSIQANLPIDVSLFDIPRIRERFIHSALE